MSFAVDELSVGTYKVSTLNDEYLKFGKNLILTALNHSNIIILFNNFVSKIDF